MFDFLTPFFCGNLALSIVGLLGGVALLWLSSNLVIAKITPIARFFGVRELVITILGVSVLSSLPEFTVSLFAGMAGKADVSIGNVIGSNFVTLTFVTALCALIRPLKIEREIRDRESSWMILSTAVIMVLAMDGRLSRGDGILLTLLYVPYLLSVISDARSHPAPETQANKDNLPKLLLHIGLGLAAIFGIIAGADLSLKSGEALGTIMHIPPILMGVVIFAVGTSLPELAIALSATLKNKGDITIGEIYASNIFTALFVLGVSVIVTPMSGFDSRVVSIELPLMILAGVMIQIFITSGNKLVRLEAFLILGLYAAFIAGHFLPIGFSLP